MSLAVSECAKQKNEQTFTQIVLNVFLMYMLAFLVVFDLFKRKRNKLWRKAFFGILFSSRFSYPGCHFHIKCLECGRSGLLNLSSRQLCPFIFFNLYPSSLFCDYCIFHSLFLWVLVGKGDCSGLFKSSQDYNKENIPNQIILLSQQQKTTCMCSFLHSGYRFFFFMDFQLMPFENQTLLQRESQRIITVVPKHSKYKTVGILKCEHI